VETIIEIYYLFPESSLSLFDFIAHLLILPIFLIFGLVISNIIGEQKRLNNVISSINNVNQLIIREKGLERLIEETCDNLTYPHAFDSAWIIIFDENYGVNASAESGIDVKFNDFLNRYEKNESIQCIRKVFNKSDILVIENNEISCSDCPLHSEEPGENSIVSKLQYGNKIYGLMAVSGPKNIISEREKELFQEVANDISYALYNIEAEEKLKEKDKKLEESEQRFRSYVDNSPIGIFVTDKHGYYLDVNPVSASITGYSIDELRSMKVGDLHPDDAYNDAQKVFNELVEIGNISVELPYITKNGERKYWILDAVKVNYNKFLGFTTDITDRKLAENKLKESEEKYRFLVETTDDIIIYHDKDGYIQFINEAGKEFCGLSDNNPNNKNINDFIPDDEKEYLVERKSKRLAGEDKRFRYETNVLDKNGKLFTMDISSRSVFINGQLQGTLLVAHDVTERKKTERKLKESERRFRTLIEHAADAVIVHDFDGNVVFANEFACENLGYSRDELLSMNVTDFDPYVDIDVFREKYWNKTSPDASYLVETYHKRKDGTTFPVEIRLTRIDLDDKPAILGFVRDITMRKEAEDNLIYSKMEAEATSRAKSELLANVSHELRTPLTTILGFSDVILKEKAGKLNNTQKKYLSKIYDKGQQLHEIIDEMVDLSKIETGELDINYEDINLSKFVNELESKIYPLATEKGLNLDFEIYPEIEYIHADRLKLKQILSNLLHNAVKFTDEGSITFKMEIDESDKYRFSVIDTGIGIPEDKKDEIFEPFKQLDSGSNRRYSGTGLGLTLVKRLVKLHGGELEIESVEGEGSKLTFTIPSNR
jgi:PAS domain S-box-containing protein